jgi:hypothetical protein
MARGGPRQARRRLSLWAKRNLTEIDGRLMEAREEKKLMRALVDHVGGEPSAPQLILIQRTTRLLLMLGILERRVLETHDLGDLQARQMIALANSVRQNLVALGLKPTDPPRTLRAYLVEGKAA